MAKEKRARKEKFSPFVLKTNQFDGIIKNRQEWRMVVVKHSRLWSEHERDDASVIAELLQEANFVSQTRRRPTFSMAATYRGWKPTLGEWGKQKGMVLGIGLSCPVVG